MRKNTQSINVQTLVIKYNPRFMIKELTGAKISISLNNQLLIT
jgi:hypothetical protein